MGGGVTPVRAGAAQGWAEAGRARALLGSWQESVFLLPPSSSRTPQPCWSSGSLWGISRSSCRKSPCTWLPSPGQEADFKCHGDRPGLLGPRVTLQALLW